MDKLLRWIKDERVKSWCQGKVEMLPAYFWKVPASSTGKHHPRFAQGEGGLVGHTRGCVWFALQLFEVLDLDDLEQDIILAALILHDGFKYGGGKGQEFTVDDHGELAASIFAAGEEDLVKNGVRHMILDCIEKHMGKWGKRLPETELEKIVHLCDYLASRKDLDIRCNKVGLG